MKGVRSQTAAPPSLLSSDDVPLTVCEGCGSPAQNFERISVTNMNEPEAWFQIIIRRHNPVAEQAKVLRLVAEGRNVFFTRAAGTGKSTVIDAIQEYLQGVNLLVATIVPTYIAALSLGGRTLHSYAGWNNNIYCIPIEELCLEDAHEKTIWRHFNETNVLIIEEISMVNSDNVTRLSLMMQSAASRHKNGSDALPFGGAQAIVTGDFYQLPPVKPFEICLFCSQELKKTENGPSTYSCKDHGTFEEDEKWAFRSPVWQACSFATVELTQVRRQSNSAFMTMLHQCRKGDEWTAEQQDQLLDHPHNVMTVEATKILRTREAATTIKAFIRRI